MKNKIIQILGKITQLDESEISNSIEVPPSRELGDYAFPCFSLAKFFKKNPNQIAAELAEKISSKEFEKVEAKGPYINFFLNRNLIAESTLKKILKEKEQYGFSLEKKSGTIVIDMSSPNIAKPFGIGHLRSTIIGNAIANLAATQGCKVIRLNYLGDWGTPFGKIIAGYKKFGSEKELNKHPIQHLYEIYTKVSALPEFEEIGRQEFRKLEEGDKNSLRLWKKFREVSIKDFNRIYSLLGIKFDATSGESEYNNKMDSTISSLKSRGLLKTSDGAKIVDLEKYGLGVCLIQKADGATLYATRDITAAIDRVKRYKAKNLFYEVGSEQQLHFKQLFKVLELMGCAFAKNCVHISHGLYLDKDGKKLATRKGKTIFMEDIIEETIELAKKEIVKREKISSKELSERALKIARAAIFYGDLKNYRMNDIIFDIERFLEFEGNTGPYLLYTYVRAQSILTKAAKKHSKLKIGSLNDQEKSLILDLAKFPEEIKNALDTLAPNIVANYVYALAHKFNEFYHSNKVIGSENEQFRLALVASLAQVIKNSLSILGIDPPRRM